MKHVPLIIFGAGNVGRALVEQLLEAGEVHAARDGLAFGVVAWCDIRGAIVDEKGIPGQTLRAALAAQRAGAAFGTGELGAPQSDLAAIVDVAGQDGGIVVDVTASDATAPALALALERGYGAVTANKLPVTGPQDVFDRLTASGRFRYESTVGSAVPVIEAALGLVRAADRVDVVRGVLSGTLGFLMSGLEADRSFSALVAEAVARGYSEPDPRADLGGLDVARKALIIARTLGWRMELAEIPIGSLIASLPADLDRDAFLDRLPDLDREYAQQAGAASQAGKVLRYVAELRDGRAEVGVQAVPLDTALGQLRGSDNLVAFHTRCYADAPLVLQGRGAGADAAAAGVHADIVALAARMGR